MPTSSYHPDGRFATTCWSLVVAAGRHGERNPDAETALATLCQAYWFPLYEYARRAGQSAPDAADLTQAFFATLLEKQYLRSADRDRGRFRTFLLTAFQRFLCNAHDHEMARKRGGSATTISLDAIEAESRLGREPAMTETPEAVFERRWAVTVLERSLALVETEMQDRGKGAFFDRVRGCLSGAGTDASYAAIGTEFGLTESATKVAIHRLRGRFRELLLQEVRQTVDHADEVDDELRALLRAVRR